MPAARMGSIGDRWRRTRWRGGCRLATSSPSPSRLAEGIAPAEAEDFRRRNGVDARLLPLNCTADVVWGSGEPHHVKGAFAHHVIPVVLRLVQIDEPPQRRLVRDRQGVAFHDYVEA